MILIYFNPNYKIVKCPIGARITIPGTFLSTTADVGGFACVNGCPYFRGFKTRVHKKMDNAVLCRGFNNINISYYTILEMHE